MKHFTFALLFSFACSALHGETVLTNKKLFGNQPIIRVMSYNVAAGAKNFKVNLTNTANALKAVGADIIALQEIDRLTVRSGNVDQIKVLSELSGYPYYVFGKAIDFDGGEYGISILSKHPIVTNYQIDLPSGDEQRIALIAQVDAPGFPLPITFINTHLDWHEDPKERMSQIYALDEHILDLQGIKILAGDLNDTLNSGPINQLTRYWNSIFPPRFDNRSWPALNPAVGIDHIFTSKAQVWEINVHVPNAAELNEKYNVDWQSVSDHIPVIGTLKLVEQ